MNAEEKSEYADKIIKRRVKERITLKHKTKSKYIEKMMRYAKGNQKNIQDSIN